MPQPTPPTPAVSVTSPITAPPVAVPPVSAANPEPAAPPVAAGSSVLIESTAPPRVGPSVTRRTRLLDYWRAMPAWLASLVLHLSMVSICATIMIPSGRAQIAHLFLSWVDSTEDGDLESESMFMSPPLEVVAPDESGDQGLVPLPADGEDQGESAALLSELVAEQSNVKLVDLTAHLPVPEKTDLKVDPPVQDPAPADDDDVVDRFIRYDIGKLQGDEGERARRDFNRLGPNSIPALVRGLNKSAYISATCPIVVLQSKLTTSLAQSRDPVSIRYVIDNIGQGVSPDAAHAEVLKNFRATLMQRFMGDEQFVRELLAARGIPNLDERLVEIRRLRMETTSALAAAYASRDRRERLNAMIATSVRDNMRTTDAQRADLADRLIDSLRDRDHEVNEAVQHALVALAPPDVRGAPTAAEVDANTRLAAERWQMYWDQFRTNRNVEGRATAELRLANTARERRQARAADMYRQIIVNHPGTEAAQLAKERLVVPTSRKSPATGRNKRP